jgi:hypothetical protein
VGEQLGDIFRVRIFAAVGPGNEALAHNLGHAASPTQGAK